MSVRTNNIPVRTLCVGPIKADMSEQIKVYFDRFGAVNSVEIEQEDNGDKHFGLVEFKTVEAAAAILSSSPNESHHINDCDVQVKAAEPWQQPDHILNALDDDCLRAILLQLNQLDLFNAAEVCVRFNQQAKSVFSTKHKKLELSRSTFEEAKKMLQNYGSLAKSVDIRARTSHSSRCEHENRVLTLIARCCTTKLTELTLRNFTFAIALPTGMEIATTLSKLETLSFIDCDSSNKLIDLLSICTELKILHLENSFIYFDFHTFPKFDCLEELRLSKTSGFVGRFLNGFSVSNPTLKKLCVRISQSRTINVIVRNFPKLLELDLTMKKKSNNSGFTDGIRHLGGLKSLTVLKIKLNSKLIVEQLAMVLTTNAVPVEHMRLVKGKFDMDDIKAISKMKQLKVLELRDMDGLTDEHMIELARGLGCRLEKLQLEGSVAEKLTTIGLKEMLPFAKKLSNLTMESTKLEIVEKDYEEMLDVLQKRPERIRFLMDLAGEFRQVYVNTTILEKNHDVLCIDEKICKNNVTESNDFHNCGIRAQMLLASRPDLIAHGHLKF